MRSAEARDAMVARVKAAFDEFPDLRMLPEVPFGDVRVKLAPTHPGDFERAYVEALHQLCAEANLTGLVNGGDGYYLTGSRLPPEE